MSFAEKLQTIAQLQQAIEQHGKLKDDLLKKINYKFRLEWNYTSNSMEGNSLTKQETRSVMVGNITVEGKPIKDVLEIKGHDEVITQILQMGKGELNISEKRIKEVHKAIIHEEDPEKQKQVGIWKTQPNYLHNYKGERFDFVAPAEVPERMHQLINELNVRKNNIKSSIDAVELACWFHLEYITIHPFYDGNGRTARIFTNLILISYGLPPLYIKEEERSTYYQYLADIQGYGGSAELFYEFMADRLIRSLQIVLDAIEGKDIEEKDDWEKQLILLRTELNDTEEVKIPKTNEAVLKVFTSSILSFLEKLLPKLESFDDFFAERQIYFGPQRFRKVAKDIESIKYIFSTFENFDDGVVFQYSLNGFKRADTNTFNIYLQIEWSFDQYSYSFIINQVMTASRKKLYHQFFTEEEVNEFVAMCGRNLIEQINKRRNG